MKIYKVRTPLWWRTRLLNHVRCKKKEKKKTSTILERKIIMGINDYVGKKTSLWWHTKALIDF